MTDQARPDEPTYVCHTHGTDGLPYREVVSELIDGTWWWVCQSGKCNVKSGENVQSDLPALMDGQTYFDLCDRLIAAHPEDLINIISRVLEQRADVEHIRTEPEAGSGTTSIETGQFKVPGCPGARDCTDPMHADGHLVIADRLFTIAVRGRQV